MICFVRATVTHLAVILSSMNGRVWLRIAVVGCVVVVLGMLAAALVILDKQRFGWMVGSTFLGVLSSGVIVGGLAVLVGAAMLPERKSWRGLTLIVWGLIALTSPLFGFMFLLPWGLLALSLPVVIAALRGLSRAYA